MARPRSSAVKPVRKTLADGSVRIYYYDRTSGALLSIDNATAAAARATAMSPASASATAPGTMAALVADYLAGSKPRRGRRFPDLAPRTRELYRKYLELICPRPACDRSTSK